MHGEIVAVEDTILSHEDMVELMQPICPERLRKEYTEGGDADFAYEMDEKSRFRCNFMKQQRGYCCMFRLIPTKILTMEQLNVPEQIKRFGEMKSGLVPVTGPTGSGKSTTLASIIREGAARKLADVITGGKGMGMQFMDDAMWDKLVKGLVSPEEAYMKAIDKNRFKNFLPPESASLANAGGA